MAQKVEEFALKFDNLSWSPGIFMALGENHVCVCVCVCKCNKSFKNKTCTTKSSLANTTLGIHNHVTILSIRQVRGPIGVRGPIK